MILHVYVGGVKVQTAGGGHVSFLSTTTWTKMVSFVTVSVLILACKGGLKLCLGILIHINEYLSK